ncbi:MAG: TolC family protein [Deltaproteobacteria bacterium]|nr:TolC family protein [Deltaproteobacteria bacterium]
MKGPDPSVMESKMISKHHIKIFTLFFIGVFCLFAESCAPSLRSSPNEYIGPPKPAISVPQEEKTERVTKIADVQEPVITKGPLKVTARDAILMTLENNRALLIEKLNPEIYRAGEEKERAIFDPVLTGGYSRFRDKRDSDLSSVGNSLENEVDTELGISGHIPTGTDLELGISTGQAWSNVVTDDQYESRLGLSVTQALLRGGGLKYNLARLHQARLDTRTSQYELRGFAEALVAEVEETYWDYALTERQIEIFQESLKLAEKQKSETEEIIRIGSLAESELTAAEAEIALRREGLINARSALGKTRLQLLRLLNPPGKKLWSRDLVILDQPVAPDVILDDVEDHVGVALRMRPDLNQARLQVLRGDLEIVRTKNGVLPKLDFFINLGKTGYAGAFNRSVNDIDGNSYDILAGINLQYPVLNRDARARHRESLLSRKQADESVKNMAQLVQVDVRSAYIEVSRSGEQIAATTATRTLQEEKARIEMEKFRVGKSTTLLVAQAQRDLLASRIGETEAIANYLKSLVELYRLEGSLLERRGIEAPGHETVSF